MNNHIHFGSLTKDLKHQSAWNDDYPAHQEYADEAERLLRFLLAGGALQRYWTRLTSKPQQRDEALNEVRVAYFLASLGYPVCNWDEPEDAPGRNVEFAVSLGLPASAFIEVKSPGWESELTPAERQAGRAKQPKFIGMEGRAAGPVQIIQRALTKAMPKFTGNAPSIVFIADDCFMNLIEWGFGPPAMALTSRTIGYGDGLFHQPAYSVIGAACLFRAVLYADGNTVDYENFCIPNPNAKPAAAIPSDIVSRLQRTKLVPVHK